MIRVLLHSFVHLPVKYPEDDCMRQIKDAYERLLKGYVKYRFVIDIASLKN